MTKSDLKNGMVVAIRNGNMYLVHNDKLIRKDGFVNLYTSISGYYNEDMTRTNNSDFDIIRVFRSNAQSLNTIFNQERLELIWERKEDKQELSKKDKKIIKKGLKKAQEYCNSLISCKDCEFHEGAYCKFDCFSMSTDLDEFFKN